MAAAPPFSAVVVDMSFTTSEQVALLYKKLLGAPSTLETTEFFSEPSRPARPAVFQSQFLSEKIPDVAPSDLAAATLDDVGAPLAGSLAGKTSMLADGAMVRRYLKVALTAIPGTQENAYECALDATHGRVLQDAIPFNYDSNGSYLYTVYKNDGVTEIPFGSGSWLLDTESGVLTFYARENVTGVSAALPPKISFFRYVGQKGAATSEATAAAIANQAIDFSKEIVFSGGSTTAADDTLAAIQLDTRDIAALPTTAPSMSVQLGGDTDGSWRIVIYGGGGDATRTSLQIEARIGGAWVSKQSFFAQ